jgi:hypothetical protein
MNTCLLTNGLCSSEVADIDLHFWPIPELVLENSTVTLVFAVFFGTYTEPSDDLWFPAHLNVSVFLSEVGSPISVSNYYAPDAPISVMACTEQYQFCNPSAPSNSPSCTSLQSSNQMSDDTFGEIAQIFTNKHQQIILNMVDLVQSSISPVIEEAPLLANALAKEIFSLPLAPNQWNLEVQNWFRIVLANMQFAGLYFATGPPIEYTQPGHQLDNITADPDLRWLCQNFIIRRNDYTNFRTLAIGLVFGLGTLIISVSLCLETIVGMVRSKWRRGRWRQRAWWAEGTLQLQRRVFDGMGIHNWEIDEWSRVPITDEKVVFSALKNWDDMLPIVTERKVNSVAEKQKVPSPSLKSGMVLVQVDSAMSTVSGQKSGNVAVSISSERPHSM